MLQDYYALLEVTDKEILRDHLVKFAGQLGFNTVSAMLVVDQPQGPARFLTIDNTPEAYTEAYYASGGQDPVMSHCRDKSVPIIWNQETYVRAGQGAAWEEQARFGYRTGAAVVLHMPAGRHFMLGVDRDRPLPTSSQELTRIVADLQLYATYAQEAAAKVFAASPEASPAAQHLTPRETEVLRWTMEGKTAWEIGVILSISERTAVMHINNAMKKLECASKYQAVVKAMRLGLIG